MKKPLISVIVPTYNRSEMLHGALESLVRQETGDEFEYEVIVVDNASTDATPAVVEKVAGESLEPVRCFYHEITGPASARNCGLANAQGEWLAFFDDDELATTDWLRQLYRGALETKAPVVGGAMQLDLPEKTLNRLGRVVRQTSLREIDYYPTIHLYTENRLPGTNNALVARQVFDTVGTFDVSRLCGGSDSDFFLRARAAGMDLYYTPHAVVRHRVAPNRLTQEYLRWDARQGCSAFAGLDFKFKGPVRCSRLVACGKNNSRNAGRRTSTGLGLAEKRSGRSAGTKSPALAYRGICARHPGAFGADVVPSKALFLRPGISSWESRWASGSACRGSFVKLLQVYNDYRSAMGGEAGVVQMIATIVEKRGGQARLMTRSSKGLDRTLAGRIRGFFSGIYDRSAYREMERMLAEDRPDVVHVHNLYPLISPSVLVACRRAGVPVVMTNHNYVLTCPIVNHLHQGRVCEKCLGGREYWCVLQNCRGSRAESLAYAVRSATARKLGFFRRDVTIQIVLSEFAKLRLLKEGFDEERIVVLPNMVELGPESAAQAPGKYAAFSGRMMPEKGVDVLLAAAARLPDVSVRLAGDGPSLEKLSSGAPANSLFVNRLGAEQMAAFYRGARFLVVPSKWFEGCPLVVSEAMSHGLPVIASRIGGLPEFVEEGVTGLLFEPGNVAELADKIRLLWGNPDLCRRMGAAGRQKASREYNEEVYYQRLMSVYDKAIELNERQLRSRV